MAPGSVNPNFPKIYISAAISLVNHLKFFIKKNNGNQLSLTTTLYRDLLTVHWFALYFCDGQKSHSVAEDNPGLYLIIAAKYTFATTNCFWTCEDKLVWSICIKLYLTGIGKISWFSSENIVWGPQVSVFVGCSYPSNATACQLVIYTKFIYLIPFYFYTHFYNWLFPQNLFTIYKNRFIRFLTTWNTRI